MFRACFIETWGRGYSKVRESFEADNYPMPVITEIDGGVSVWIKRFSLDELAARNKERYGDKAPSLQGTITNDVGINVGITPEKNPVNAEKPLGCSECSAVALESAAQSTRVRPWADSSPSADVLECAHGSTRVRPRAHSSLSAEYFHYPAGCSDSSPENRNRGKVHFPGNSAPSGMMFNMRKQDGQKGASGQYAYLQKTLLLQQ